ncbi:TerD family protein [Streptomyces fractus]|uniref:TerD family protein n=1 Tax=Streptomyces fractus TaxID=641806 RepID=UPI003CE80F94
MGFGFRVGVPGMSVRVSTRGVRTSVGPRAARLSVGSGGARVSSGLGPFYASSSVGGNRRRTTTRRTATRSRTVAPSAAQLDRARRQAERAQQQAERDAAIARLTELRREMTTVHLQSFPDAHAPVVPETPQLGEPWALAEAQAFHLRGVRRLARAERAAARRRAELDAPVYLAAERARLRDIRQQWQADADRWWRALNANDEDTVCEAVNTAFSDNPAAGCAVGVDGSVLSVVMRQQDLDSLPTQTPGTTPSGRPTLKNLTKRDRVLWWLTAMGSNIVATLKEGFATAPGITAIDLAVLTRLPDTQRLGFVAYGRWTRRAIDTTPWREPGDALRFLDIGEDVVCSVTTTASGNLSSTFRPLDTGRTPGLQDLLDHAQDQPDTGEGSLGDLDIELGANHPDGGPAAVTDPFLIRSFAEWKQATPAAQAVAQPAAQPVAQPVAPGAPADPPVPLVPGQTLVLPEEACHTLSVAFAFAGADADLTLFLGGEDGRVSGDEDFVFYHQPSAAGGAARLLGKHQDGPVVTERATVHLAALPDLTRRVTIAVNMDVDTGLSCASLTHALLTLDGGPGAAWAFRPPADPDIRAMAVAELYRHVVEGRPVWKLRAIGQGWSEGLDALARAYGVDVE